MIKIVLTGKQKKEIEKIHIDTLFDGKNRPKSLEAVFNLPKSLQ